MEPGTLLQKRYRIRKQIGQGGMGTVFVGTDERFGSTVAIKETFFEDEKLSRAFVREARLLNGLKHPALPKVSDYFNENKSRYIVMEFIAGEDLSEILDQSTEPFALEDVLNWADQLCNALEYLHTQEMPVIHRDIKPQNLKLTPEGQIILLDFGLAKGNPNDASHKTAAKSIFGYSRNYASLEQMQGTGTDPQSDLYSLAATLYHLATGIPPADALTRAMNVLNGQPDPLIPANLINRQIPPGVAQVLQKSMALNAGERPATAVELHRMLVDCDKTLGQESDARANFVVDLSSNTTQLNSAETNAAFANPSLASVVDMDTVETRIIGDTSDSGDAKTESFPVAAASRRRPIYLGAALICGLLTIGGLAFYFNGIGSTEEAIKPVQLTQPVVNHSIDALPSETDQAAEDAPANLPESDESMTQTETKAVEGQKPAPVASKPETAEKKSASPESYVIETDDGRIVIRGDTMETDEYIMDERGIRLKNPNQPPPTSVPRRRPPIPAEQLRELTREQRDALRNIRKMEEQRRLETEKKQESAPPKMPSNQP